MASPEADAPPPPAVPPARMDTGRGLVAIPVPPCGQTMTTMTTTLERVASLAEARAASGGTSTSADDDDDDDDDYIYVDDGHHGDDDHHDDDDWVAPPVVHPRVARRWTLSCGMDQ